MNQNMTPLKVTQKDLEKLTPGKDGTFAQMVEKFLQQTGYDTLMSPEQRSKLGYYALIYWKDHKHPNVTEASWLYAYANILKIDLDLSL